MENLTLSIIKSVSLPKESLSKKRIQDVLLSGTRKYLTGEALNDYVFIDIGSSIISVYPLIKCDLNSDSFLPIPSKGSANIYVRTTKSVQYFKVELKDYAETWFIAKRNLLYFLGIDYNLDKDKSQENCAGGEDTSLFPIDKVIQIDYFGNKIEHLIYRNKRTS